MKTVVKEKLNWKDKRFNCQFSYVTREGRHVIAKGRRFLVDGVEIELFPTSTLAGILHRNYTCIYTWERDFGFPLAMWVVHEDRLRNRWYSRKQLIAIQTIYERFNRLEGRDRYKLDQFIAAVRAIFYIVDMPADQMRRDAPEPIVKLVTTGEAIVRSVPRPAATLAAETMQRRPSPRARRRAEEKQPVEEVVKKQIADIYGNTRG